MPSLWATLNFGEYGFVFTLATGPYDRERKGVALACDSDYLVKRHGQIRPDEIAQLENLSSEFYSEACHSQLLTELEARYLLYWI